ncbi:MAG TPA: class I SAM-dependent methyltransferase [Mycobacteriales bacterium]|jgi:SAM-dependent methyltransferase|nr:class I SAM-dependent methyltransferase [Mycobacteriales bacterium]
MTGKAVPAPSSQVLLRPDPTTREQAAQLQFAEGARLFLTRDMGPRVKREFQHLLRAVPGVESGTVALAEVADRMRRRPVVSAYHRLARSVQEMIWSTTSRSLRQQQDALLAELEASDAVGPGTVAWDPDFTYPDYLAGEFHLQAGGYTGTPLAGHIYHLGGNVFHGGLNDTAEGNATIVASVPLPPEGPVDRVLELACSVGLSTVPLKERLPDAEVWAIDVSAPMVRYAHKRAAEAGLEIHFRQMLAEDLVFPDGHFDLVFVHILFHELPASVTRQVLREVYRVLRPGGLFAVSDIRNESETPPGSERIIAEYNFEWQAGNNGERYQPDFYRSDFTRALGEVGFSSVEAAWSGNDGAWQPNLSLPLRVAVK